MNFFEHLEEFRKRIIRSVLFFAATFILLWFLRDDLLNLYLLCINSILRDTQSSVILLKITDKFFIHIKTVFFFGILFTFPFIYLQVWQFIRPALYENEKKYFVILFLFSLALFYCGILSAYYVLIPVGFKFLVNYSVSSSPLFIKTGEATKLFISLSEQVHLTQTLILMFALLFQTPLLVLCLIRTGLINPETMTQYRKHVVVVCFIIAAILTQPDAVSMCLMAVPLIVLFETGLLINRLIRPQSQPLQKSQNLPDIA